MTRVPGAEAETIAEIVDDLRTDPVVVHEMYGLGRTDEVREDLTDLVDDAGVPVFVALVQHPADALAADAPADDLVRLLHSKMDEPGVYLASTGSTVAVAAYDVPIAEVPFPSSLRFEIGEDLDPGTYVSAAGDVALALRALQEDDARLTRDQADDVLESGDWLVTSVDEPADYEIREAQGEPLTILVVAVVAGVTALVVGWRLLRARSAWMGAPPEPLLDVTRRRAASRITTLSRAIDKHRTHDDRFLDASDALSRAQGLSDSDDVLDVVAAMVIATQGSALLRGTTYHPCFFDPLHGTGTTTARTGGAEVPACRDCAAAVGRGAAPRALRVAHRRRAVPYYETDSLWARTGLGALSDALWREGVPR